MQLVVHELVSSLYQEMTTTKAVMIAAIRPKLYIHGSPAGSIVIHIRGPLGNLIAESDFVSIASLKTAAYAHKYYRFDVSAFLQAGKTFRVYLASTGYTFNESAYVGWCNDFDLRKYDPAYEVATPFNSPLDLEVWTRSLK